LGHPKPIDLQRFADSLGHPMEAADGADLFGCHSSMVVPEDGDDGEEEGSDEEDRRPTGSTEVR